MQNSYDHIDDLIGKYLAGEASSHEISAVESWVSENEANRKYFNQVKTIFQRSSAVTEVQEFNSDLAWSRVRAKLKESQQGRTVIMQPNQRSGLPLFFRIAASIIVILGIGFFAYRALKPTEAGLQVATSNETKADTLPDGSNVYLNKQTQLAYAFNKETKQHIVKLKGEAYFNIQHNDEKEFLVALDDVFIKDIGTSFNVKAYPDSSTIEVVVEEGEVMFYTATDSGIMLRAKGKGVYDKRTKTFSVDMPEPNVTAYKTKHFIFADVDLARVIEEVNSVYDEKITISPKVTGCRLTVTFNNESVEDIASVIAETLGLRLTKSNKGYFLEGEGCVE